MSNAKTKLDLEDHINSFAWEKRIVLFITKAKYVHFINETDNFFKKNSCENESRNLIYIRIVGDDINKYIITLSETYYLKIVYNIRTVDTN